MSRTLMDEFYEALQEEIAEQDGGDRRRAFKRLGAGKRLIESTEECWENEVQPQAGTLETYMRTGGRRLSDASEAWLKFIQAPPGKDARGEFSFLYAGMQLLLADYDGLLRGCIDREPPEDLEELAAIGLVRSFVAGHYCWGIVNCGGHLVEPVEEFPENEEEEFIRTTRDLLKLARDDERALYERLDSCLGLLLKSVEQPTDKTVTVIEAARLMPQMYAYVYCAHRAAETFLKDAEKVGHLKERPLYRLAMEMCKILDARDVTLRLVVEQQLQVLAKQEPSERPAAADFVNTVARCVTGNRPVNWMGETVTVHLWKDTVRLEDIRTRGAVDGIPKKPDRIGKGEHTPLTGIEPCNDRDAYWIFDPYNLHAEKTGAKEITVTHWVHAWRRGDSHQRPTPMWSRRVRKAN